MSKVRVARNIYDSQQETMSIDFSPDMQYIAQGCSNGSVYLHSVPTPTINKALTSPYSKPVTGISFGPTGSKLVSVQSNGSMCTWNYHGQLIDHQKLNTELYTIKYNNQGNQFAVAGRDQIVHIFDDATNKETQKLQCGHNNRIFGLAYDSQTSSVLYSGGWDNIVQIWDLRIGQPVQSIHSVQVCGDSIDELDGKLLIGSWRPNDCLQVYDLRQLKQKLISIQDLTMESDNEIIVTNNLPFNRQISPAIMKNDSFIRQDQVEKSSNSDDSQKQSSNQQQNNPTLIYTCKFNRAQPRLIFGAGSGGNMMKIFDLDSNSLKGVLKCQSSIYCSALSANGALGAVAGDSFGINIFNFDK
ncbi:WD40 repeat protein [Spironucleus salmonicida]|uniref:WD40 repeat protein n=1 Tax=Spironucleus salmonicida TaxID=348837 RepID=V6LDZ0_9EUKA|nr:WD40 repeat protein [Spironucleus salmonicida]|eukprot:EST42498.1 hypothetical protein SS50377_17804 [Spironucleus salmonicida]